MVAGNYGKAGKELRQSTGVADAMIKAKLPLYLGFFEFVHNARKRGKALLQALIELLFI